MAKAYRFYIILTAICFTVALGIGYAAIADPLFINGSVEASPTLYDVYISDVTPDVYGGTQINNYFSTVLSAKTVAADTSPLPLR